MDLRVGIDTGGTFTDLVGVDEESGRLLVGKEPSTPEKPALAVGRVLGQMDAPASSIGFLILGTTVATNALIQRSGACVVYITTKGFEDVPFIQRIDREEVYNPQWQKPKPLVKRANCLGSEERIGYKGQVIKPVGRDALEGLGDLIDKRLSVDGVEAIAVCLLFSYLNNENELALKEYLEGRYPQLSISLSHEVCPLWREFERASTTIADAFVKPVTGAYIDGLQEEFGRLELKAPWCVMKSNGGSMLAAQAVEQPVQTLLSGLAGGVIGGRYFGEMAAASNVFTLDMGGTSCDVGMVQEGHQAYASEFQLGFGLPISVPCVDISTIGAGGGSIGWVDKGGFLRVGPRSAGASPGPAAYGQGGREPTVTDANLVLGYLNPSYFLGGKMPLYGDKAEEAIQPLGEGLGVSPVEAAEAIRQVVNENMANALRLVAVKRGVDPREFSLVAFGGAGPVHAVAIAEALRIPRVLVPLHPGHCSAFGVLISDWRVDKVLTRLYRSDTLDVSALDVEFRQLAESAVEELSREGFRGEPIVLRSIDMRYQGQNYEQEVDIGNGPIAEVTVQKALDRFTVQHEAFAGSSFPDAVIELVNLRVTAIGPSSKIRLERLKRGDAPRPTEHRSVYFSRDGFQDTPIYRREELSGGCHLRGPAVVEEVASTTVVPEGFALRVDDYGLITILSEEAHNGKA
jgi:N-methylhydantoinase A